MNTVESINDQIDDPIGALSQVPNSHNVDVEINQMIQSYAADIGSTLVEQQNSDVLDRQTNAVDIDEQLNLSQIVVEKPKTPGITSKYSFPKPTSTQEVIVKPNTKSFDEFTAQFYSLLKTSLGVSGETIGYMYLKHQYTDEIYIIERKLNMFITPN